jgi:hypothetical protein
MKATIPLVRMMTICDPVGRGKGRKRKKATSVMSSATEFDEAHMVEDIKTCLLERLPGDTDIAAS